MSKLVALLAIAAVAALSAADGALAKPPTTFNPVVEAENFLITQQRQTTTTRRSYQAQLLADGLESGADALAAQAADPQRMFTTICAGAS